MVNSHEAPDIEGEPVGARVNDLPRPKGLVLDSYEEDGSASDSNGDVNDATNAYDVPLIIPDVESGSARINDEIYGGEKLMTVKQVAAVPQQDQTNGLAQEPVLIIAQEDPELAALNASHPLPPKRKSCGFFNRSVMRSLPAIYNKTLVSLTDEDIKNHILEVAPKMKKDTEKAVLAATTLNDKGPDIIDFKDDIYLPAGVSLGISVAATDFTPASPPVLEGQGNNAALKKNSAPDRKCKRKVDPTIAQYNDPEYVTFGHKPVLRTLLTIAASTASSELIKSLYVFVDGLFIASSGSDALSALSNISHVEALWQVLGGWLSVGGNAAISSLVAKHEYHLAEFVISSVFIYSLVIAALIAAFVIPFDHEIISWVLGNDKPSIMKQASDYVIPMSACSAILILYLACGGIVQGLGYAKIYSMVSVICVVLNCAVFNPILITWQGMGIIGAAWACIICQGIAVLIYIGFFIWMNKSKKCHVKFRPFLLFYYKRFLAKRGLSLPVRPTYSYPRTLADGKTEHRRRLTKLERKALKDERNKIDTRGSVTYLLICVGAIDGIAAASAVAVTSVATVFVNKIASTPDEITNLTITSMWTACLRIASLATSIMIGFSQAQLSLSAYAFSSRRFSRLIDIFKKSGITMITGSAIITILIEACADVIPYMFALEDESAAGFYDVTPTALRIFSATIFISGAQYVCCAHCQAVGMVARGLLLAIFTQLVFGPVFFIIFYYITEALEVENPIDQFYYCLISYNANDVVSIIVGITFLTKPFIVLNRLIKWQNAVKKFCKLTGRATTGEEVELRKIEEKEKLMMI